MMMDSGLGYSNDDDYGERRPNPTHHSEKIRTDRKTFFLDLKENFRGRFVKITEDVRGRRDTILVPIEALDEFAEAVQAIREAEAELPEFEEDDRD